MESQQGTLQTTVRLKARAKALSSSDHSFSVQSKRGIYLDNTPGLKNIYSIFTYRKTVVFTGKKNRTGLDCPAELISVSKISKTKCQSSHVLLQTGLPMCLLIKQCPEDANKPPTCPFLVSSLTGSFRNHTAYKCQPCHRPSQTLCRHGPADHQPPALGQIRLKESSLPTTRRCFVRVTYWRESYFSRRWQNCPHLRSRLCQISFTSFPRMAACTVYSWQGWTTTRSLLEGFSLAGLCASKSHQKELGWGYFEIWVSMWQY